MAVEAENICFESPSLAPYAMCSTKDCFVGAVLGIEDDDFCFQELEHLAQQRTVLHPCLDSYDNLAAAAAPLSSSSSSSSSFFPCSGSLPVETVQSLHSAFEKQRVEMDWFLQLEDKRFQRSILQEETRQRAIIMQRYESRTKILMLQKDEEIAMARNKTRELQHFLRGAETEAKAWEKTAKEKEAIVFDLNNRLNQAKERESLFPNPAQEDDAVSFCDSSSAGERKEEEASSKKIGCKLCKFRRSCVVLFPCRHLCCCNSCEPLLWHCPLCETVKEASLQVFLA